MNYCQNCNKPITSGAIRCRNCADKEHSNRMRGKNNPMYNSHRTGKLNPFYGKKHTLLSKLLVSITHSGRKLTRNHILKIKKANKGKSPWKTGFMPFNVRRKISKTRIIRKVAKGNKNPRFGKIPLPVKKQKYKNTLFRSSWEVAYAKYLDRNNIKWQYESKTFDLGNTTYTPDFYLPKTDEYIEIKGWWRKISKIKFKLFKRKYKNIKIKILFKKELLKKGVLNGK